MKMVSAAKLKGDENRLKVAEPFNAWTSTFGIEPVEIESPEDMTYDDFPAKTLLVPFTSDQGLCGGVNSFISRNTKDMIRKLAAQGKECDVVIIGDKGRAQLRREFGTHIKRSVTDVEQPGSFALAAALTSELMKAGCMDYDQIVILNNHFKNAAVYTQEYKVIKPFVTMAETGETLSTYEFDSDKAEAMEDLYEYMLASQVFYAFMDGACSERSARMAAMENASQNAGEMIEALTLQYNRARQSRITTELIEIISGASAIEES